MLELSCFGNVEIKQDGRPVEGFVSAKAQALLIYLAVTGRPHSRETLAGLFWGDKPEEKAKANLRKALSNLRRLVGDTITVTGQSVAFNNNKPHRLDVTAFESVWLNNDANSPNPETLRQIIELYQGDFLAGFAVEEAAPFEEWVLAQRERLRRMAVQIFYQLTAAYAARGEYAAGIDVVTRLLALEPWHEEAHRQLMTLLARHGQREAALAQYEYCRRILAEELGVEPLPETQALYHRIKASRSETPHNLPPQITPFIGRQAELGQILHNLDQPACRLLTIIGPGGIGKTRLVIKAAEQLVDSFSDGVYFVLLVGVHLAEFMTPAIAEALGCPLSGHAPAQTQLLNYLRDKNLLLVIDNLEQLLPLNGSDNLLSQILQAAPQVKILATSQQRLNLQAEWLFPLPGLAYPPDIVEPEDAPFEAVDLFAQCARRVQPNFMQVADWPAVARICRLLDGMPLAIELAATWVHVMPCAEIATELAGSLDLLTTSLQDIPERHKSMRAVFDYAWQRLPAQEQAVFKQLSVFAGEFDRQAAQQVAGASLPILAALVNNSLLRVELSGRYSMLEPLKKYAGLRLAESASPTLPEAQACHGRYYLAFLQAQEKQLQGGVQSQTLQEISIAFKNIQVAWRWAADHSQLELLEQAGTSLFLFCDIQSRFQEGDALFQYAINLIETLAQTGNPPQRRVLAGLLACRGRLLYSRGEYQTAKQALERSLSLDPTCDRPGQAAFTLHTLALVAVAQGEYQLAQQFAQESLSLCRRLNIPWDEAWTLYGLGLAAYFLGEYEPAQQFTEQSLSLHRQLGNRHGEAACLNTLGLIICGLYDSQADKYDEAREFFEQNLAIRQVMGDHWGEATALHNLGYIHFKLRQYNQAQSYFEASLKISKMADSLKMMAATGMWLGMLAMEQQDYPTARRYLLDALKIAYDNGATTRATDVLYRIGDLWWRQNRPERAAEILACVAHHPATDDRVREGADLLLAEIKAHLSPPAFEAAQARGYHVDFGRLVAEVLG